jgi:hypothetical protein
MATWRTRGRLGRLRLAAEGLVIGITHSLKPLGRIRIPTAARVTPALVWSQIVPHRLP